MNDNTIRRSAKGTARQLLTIVWAGGNKDSWGRINHSMHAALRLAIGSGLKFRPSDFDHFANAFRWGYWVNDSTEWIYTDAIIDGNVSCIEAYEKWIGREPFRGNKVSTGYTNSPYIHANSIARDRERLAVGFRVKIADRFWFVTSFNDAKGLIRLAYYSGPHQEGAPKWMLSLGHDEIRAHFPSKPKKKPAKAEPAVVQ